MRRILLGVCLLVAAGASANGALAANRVPTQGFVVYKDLRSHAVVDVRDSAGNVVSSTVEAGDGGNLAPACGDARHTFFGARWQEFEPYLVNARSIPRYLDGSASLADIVAAHSAWQTPFFTDCARPAGTSPYRAIYGGTTRLRASLADNVTTDGLNVVQFRSLAGTVCDGAFACVVVAYKRGRLTEADMLLEADLTRYGFEDYWTTEDTTWWNAVEGRYSLSDMATHEWGHFTGLGHVKSSPALTMFPFIHDGMQTLGRGDMLGLLARYE
jgi:Matrixin